MSAIVVVVARSLMIWTLYLSNLVPLQALLLPSLNSFSIPSKLLAFPPRPPKVSVSLLPPLLECSFPPSIPLHLADSILKTHLRYHLFQEAFLDLNFLG